MPHHQEVYIGGDFVPKKLVVQRRRLAKKNTRHEIKKTVGANKSTSALESAGNIMKKKEHENPSNPEAIKLGSRDSFSWIFVFFFHDIADRFQGRRAVIGLKS